MGIIGIISAILKIFSIWISAKTEKDAEKKSKKEQIFQEAKDGLEKKDPSSITAALDKLRRL